MGKLSNNYGWSDLKNIMKKYISFLGCCVAVYMKSEYNGEHREFCEDTTFVGRSWNDRIASIRVHFKGLYFSIGGRTLSLFVS